MTVNLRLPMVVWSKGGPIITNYEGPKILGPHSHGGPKILLPNVVTTLMPSPTEKTAIAIQCYMNGKWM